MPRDPRIDTLVRKLEEFAAQIRELESRHGAEREALIAASGLDPALVAAVLNEESVKSSLPSVVHSSRMDEHMQPAKDEIVQRRGVQLKFKKRPMAIASTNSGLSIFEIAEKLGKPYSTVKSWGVKALPPDEIRKTLAAKPYSVPLSAWKI